MACRFTSPSPLPGPCCATPFGVHGCLRLILKHYCLALGCSHDAGAGPQCAHGRYRFPQLGTSTGTANLRNTTFPFSAPFAKWPLFIGIARFLWYSQRMSCLSAVGDCMTRLPESCDAFARCSPFHWTRNKQRKKSPKALATQKQRHGKLLHWSQIVPGGYGFYHGKFHQKLGKSQKLGNSAADWQSVTKHRLEIMRKAGQ